MLLASMLFFAAALVVAMSVIAHTLSANGATIVRALRMETRPEWRPVPPAARAPQVRRVVRRRTVALPEWRAAA